MDDASSEFKHADPIKFRDLVASLGLDYEEGCRATLCMVGTRATLLISPR